MSNYEEAPFEDVVPAVGQRLAMGEVTDQPGAGAGAQAVHGEVCQVRACAPGRGEFGAKRNQQQHAVIHEPIDHKVQQLLRRRVEPLRVFDELAGWRLEPTRDPVAKRGFRPCSRPRLMRAIVRQLHRPNVAGGVTAG